MKKTTKRIIGEPIQTEYQEQCDLIRWCEHMREAGHDIRFYSNNNGVRIENIVRAVMLKRSGTRPGLPDLEFIVNNFMFKIEMKDSGGGRLSKEQKEYIELMSRCTNGVPVHVCNGAAEAIKVINDYLNK